MTIVTSSPFELPWNDGALVALGGLELSWQDGTEIVSDGGPFTPPDLPPGPDPAEADALPADYVLPAQSFYPVTHAVSVIDLRDGSTVDVDSMTLSTDEAAVLWTLTTTKSVGAEELFARMTLPGDPPVLQVSIDGLLWNFLIEGVARPREFGKTGVTLTGRSVTIIAAEPYSFPENWVNQGPATAAQLVDQAQLYTGIEVNWHLTDWLVPDKVWSFAGAPLAVAQRVAESVGAVVRSDRTESAITIEPRYRELANRWPYIVPDVEVFIDAVLIDNYQRADKPAFNAVYVSGQQQGVVGFVTLAGTAGDRLAPLVTDLLLTDVDAARQRGEAILGSGGPQADITLTLPVLTGGVLPGVFEVNWICRMREGTSIWYGRVKSVSVDVRLPSIKQTVVLERHTDVIAGQIDGDSETPPDGETDPTLGDIRLREDSTARLREDGTTRDRET